MVAVSASGVLFFQGPRGLNGFKCSPDSSWTAAGQLRDYRNVLSLRADGGGSVSVVIVSRTGGSYREKPRGICDRSPCLSPADVPPPPSFRLIPDFSTDETEYEYSGSEDEDEERDMGEPSSIINVPGESTLRRDFLRLQLANKERSEAQRRQQLEQQQNEEHKRLLLAERQKRIEEQKEQRRRLEEVRRRKLSRRRQAELRSYLQMFLMQHGGF